jgi:eukaryotic-like serine/threonine-protein kinase
VTSPGYPSLHDPNDHRQPPVKPGEELAGKYRIEGVVGAGAMGVVVRAWHVELEQLVAVKFLYPEFARNADGAERFRREARAAAKIKNQHVARVLDVGTLEEKNIPYIVMEYLEGRDLSQELRTQGPLPVGMAVHYVMQACEAVAEAHERGIVHRDLKPANLFLADGSHGERMIKVLDFGISKVNGTGGAQQFSLTDTATLMGSPAYMSPEQLESSRSVDGRADIWSLGVILHELIIGRVPFNGDSVPQLVRSILAGTRTTLLERDADLHGLEGVVARCLCQERDQRFECIGALREALRPYAASPLHPSHSMVASRAEASRAAPLLSSSAEAAVSNTSGDVSPPTEPKDRNEPTGGAQVPSAWGHTQRGRNRTWQRRGIPLALLLGLVSLGAYWATNLVSHSPEPVPAPSGGHLASSPSPVREGSIRPTAPPPAAPAPAAPASGVQPPALPAQLAPVPLPEPSSAPPAAEPQAPPAEAANGAPRVRVMPGLANAPSSLPRALPAATPAKQSRATSNAAPRSSTLPMEAAAPPAAVPKVAESVSSDKPKPEPSSRVGSDVPDFGGRE